MIKLAPSILSADFARLLEDVKKVEKAGCEYLHIDVMDGHFVPNITLGPGIVKSLRKDVNMVFDAHLMIENPDNYIKEFADAGCDIIVVHQEACTHLHRTIQNIKSHGIKAGVALNPATPIETIKYVLQDVDMVLLMSVNPGFGGQSYIPVVTEKIKELKALGIKTNMFTGDNKQIAEKTGKEIGIQNIKSEMLPQDKYNAFEEIINKKDEKSKVAFVGDGINDAPVLARADVGIAMGNMGSDAAIESADVILMDDKPSKIAHAIEISNKTIQIAHQNIAFALSVKMLVLILASLGLAPMWLAIFADVGVTLFAVLYAMRTLILTIILNSKAAK